MAVVSKSANLAFFLDGVAINAPLEWRDIEVIADFQNDSIQANITTDSFTFVNDARAQILQYIENGKVLGTGSLGILEGLPFRIEASNSTSALTVFDGLLNFAEGFADYPDRQRLEVAISQKASLSNLEKRLEGLTYAFLREQGAITSADYIDVKYVVIKPNQAQEIIIATIALYLLIKEIRQQIREISRDAATVAGYIAGSFLGGVGAIVFSIASLIFEIAYTVAMAIAIAKLATTLINALYPIRRKHKAITLKKLLQRACEYLGYSFNSTIQELDNYAYLPSNISVDLTGADAVLVFTGRITEGIPHVSDYGYSVAEMFALAKDLFKAKYAIVDGVVQLHWEGSEYWQKNATYKMPSVLIEKYRYNLEELKANTIISFETDIADEWTIANFTGTNYEVILNPIATRGDKESNLIRGLKQVQFPVALGNRKDTSTVLEKLVETINNFVKSIVSIFKQRINIQNVLTTNGILKVSNNNHSKPKLLYIGANGLPSNHRDLLSAKYLYQNFHYYDNFGSPFSGQKRVFESVKVPFGLTEFMQLSNNSYFTDANGDLCKAVKVSWRLGADYAIFDYWKREIFTRNIQQTEIEP